MPLQEDLEDKEIQDVLFARYYRLMDEAIALHDALTELGQRAESAESRGLMLDIYLASLTLEDGEGREKLFARYDDLLGRFNALKERAPRKYKNAVGEE
jgi:hypothetical protein